MSTPTVTVFTKDDEVLVNREDSSARGVCGKVVSTDRMPSFPPRPTSPQWVRVHLLWPGSSTPRAYSFRAVDLRRAA